MNKISSRCMYVFEAFFVFLILAAGVLMSVQFCYGQSEFAESVGFYTDQEPDITAEMLKKGVAQNIVSNDAVDFDYLQIPATSMLDKKTANRINDIIIVSFESMLPEYEDYYKNHLEQLTEQNKSRTASLHQQQNMYYPVFALVVFLVVGGFVLSWKHFTFVVVPGVGKDDSAEQSTVEISPANMKLTSSVIGLVILFLSLAFFFLYLEYVYKITEIESASSGAENIEMSLLQLEWPSYESKYKQVRV